MSTDQKQTLPQRDEKSFKVLRAIAIVQAVVLLLLFFAMGSGRLPVSISVIRSIYISIYLGILVFIIFALRYAGRKQYHCMALCIVNAFELFLLPIAIDFLGAIGVAAH